LEDKDTTWEILLDKLYRTLQSEKKTENTLIAPFHDRSHWSIVIVEEHVTYHIDTMTYHTDDRFENFLYVLHMGWALTKGVRPGSREWTNWQERKCKRIRCFQQREVWECGMLACLTFWQYLLLRGPKNAISAEDLSGYTDKWQAWDGVKARLWVVQCLYTELVRPHPDFAKPDCFTWVMHACSIREQNEAEAEDEEDTQILTPNTGKRATSKKIRPLRGVANTIGIDIRTFRVRAAPGEGPRDNPLPPPTESKPEDHDKKTKGKAKKKAVGPNTRAKRKL